MKLSALITIHDRDISVMQTVFESMRDQTHDEFVIVLDRTPNALVDFIRTWWTDDPRTRFVEIDGPKGWRSPVLAWNAGFAAVTGDHLFAFSSETVQKAGNVERVRAWLEREPKSIVFGKAECSCGPGGREVDWGGTAPGNLLVDAAHPRPLGFIWAGPMANVRQVGGMDDGFADGLWFDDDDFYFRLWQTGLDFAFDDAISGIHLHHERPVLDTRAGQAAIARNQTLILRKHGTVRPISAVQRRVEFGINRTIWRHL
jgi:hypothetical protein